MRTFFQILGLRGPYIEGVLILEHGRLFFTTCSNIQLVPLAHAPFYCLRYCTSYKYVMLREKAISRKVVGKSVSNNPERYCGYFKIISLFLVFIILGKSEKIALDAMECQVKACRDCLVHFVTITFLEIAVRKLITVVFET